MGARFRLVDILRPRAARQAIIRNELAVHQALPDEPRRDHGHLCRRVHVAQVVLAGELLDVAVQVLRRHLVEHAGMSALEHRPEAFDAVRVRLIPDVFGDAVADRLVGVRERFVDQRVIGVDGGARIRVVGHEAVQGQLVRPLDHFCRHTIRGAVLGAHHGSLAGRAATRERGPFRVAHVLALPAEVRLVNLDRSGILGPAVTAVLPRLADAMEHEPSGRLAHPDIAVQLHAADRLETRDFEVDGDRPLAERDTRVRERGPGADAEVAPAVRAPVGHRLAGLSCRGVRRAALPAAPARRPDLRLEPLGGRRLVREHVLSVR